MDSSKIESQFIADWIDPALLYGVDSIFALSLPLVLALLQRKIAAVKWAQGPLTSPQSRGATAIKKMTC